jgi:hypothetical protein
LVVEDVQRRTFDADDVGVTHIILGGSGAQHAVMAPPRGYEATLGRRIL